MFCFGCGLVGHNIENCRNPHLPFEGGTNPRGAWLRSKTYGRRIIERPEKTFCSNPLRSVSGGPFSPIPKGLLAQMADMSIHRQEGNPSGQGRHSSNPGKSPSPVQNTSQRKFQIAQQTSPDKLVISTDQNTIKLNSQVPMKRKIGVSTTMEDSALSQQEEMAGLVPKASQKP